MTPHTPRPDTPDSRGRERTGRTVGTRPVRFHGRLTGAWCSPASTSKLLLRYRRRTPTRRVVTPGDTKEKDGPWDRRRGPERGSRGCGPPIVEGRHRPEAQRSDQDSGPKNGRGDSGWQDYSRVLRQTKSVSLSEGKGYPELTSSKSH